MAKRMIIMLTAVVLFLGVIGFVKFRQIQAGIAMGASFQPPPEAVTTIVAAAENWQTTLDAIGSVSAVQGVVLSADLPGIVRKIAFESGERARAGQTLVLLDTHQEEAQLAAAEAERELAGLNFERISGLREKGVASQAEFDRAAAESKQAEARVGEIRATIDRKTIRAPFTGVLGIRQIDLGQYVSAGDPVVALQALDPIYVDFSVPQKDIGAVPIGAEVRVTADGIAVPSGKITAINSIIDEATRNIDVQATFDNRGHELRPGMFVEAHVVLDQKSAVVTIPASGISYAPYGDAVFVVEELEGPNGQKYLGVRQQFVKLGSARGDQIAVIAGVNPGEQIVTSGVFKLRNGAAVQINNDVQPSNDPSPRPEDS
jgi:membrane fusion protein, multidrug efflux system